MSDPSDPTPSAPPAGPAPPAPPRKDRLVQTRVPRELETRLKREASRRRVTVSQLIRGLLEDTVALVDGVLGGVDHIVSGSVGLAENVSRDALRIARTATGGGRRRVASPSESVSVPAHLEHVDAWNPVIMNRPARCADCDHEIVRGEQGYVGLGEGPRVWLCGRCIGGV